jgi:hypothetical protein
MRLPTVRFLIWVTVAHHSPGHSKGEIMLIDSLTRAPFPGGSCNALLGCDVAPTGRGLHKIRRQGEISLPPDFMQLSYS